MCHWPTSVEGALAPRTLSPPPRCAQNPAGLRAGPLAAAPDLRAVDDDLVDPAGRAGRGAEVGFVGDLVRVEEHDVGVGAGPDRSAIGEAEDASGTPVIRYTASSSENRPRSRL